MDGLNLTISAPTATLGVSTFSRAGHLLYKFDGTIDNTTLSEYTLSFTDAISGTFASSPLWAPWSVEDARQLQACAVSLVMVLSLGPTALSWS